MATSISSCYFGQQNNCSRAIFCKHQLSDVTNKIIQHLSSVKLVCEKKTFIIVPRLHENPNPQVNVDSHSCYLGDPGACSP